MEWLVNAYLEAEVTDAQMAAFLMAVCCRGMTRPETIALTGAMIDSGKTLRLSDDFPHSADKHSTGGVGDKTTLIAVPVAVACGAKVLKLSGASLGHTGGTLDKLGSVPGLDLELPIDALVRQVRDVGGAVAGHSKELVPADKKIYRLRDSTATVASLPLIAASVMSKKLAVGAAGIVIDVKFGSGAFLKSTEEASRLATLMIELGRHWDKRVTCVLSSQESPLGRKIGNALEVEEAVEVLEGRGPGDVALLSLRLAAEMLVSCGLFGTAGEALRAAEMALEEGSAMDAFTDIVAAQGGRMAESAAADAYGSAPELTYLDVKSPKDGYLRFVDVAAVGEAASLLAGGRDERGGVREPRAGMILRAAAGDKVLKDQTWVTLLGARGADTDRASELARSSVLFERREPTAPPLIAGVMRSTDG